MIVTGGIYREISVFPGDDQLYGSAGRAAEILSNLIENVELYSYIGNDFNKEIELRAKQWGVKLHKTLIDNVLTFRYYHGLSTPIIRPISTHKEKKEASIQVAGDVVLCFGMLEGDAIVNAECVIFDPQNPEQPSYFDSNGSTSKRLAYVLNRNEATKLTGKDSIDEAAKTLLAKKSTEVVVIKSGAFGAIVYEQEGSIKKVQAYKTPHIWPIGSGDVFAAIFAYYWGEKNQQAVEAATFASKGAALYCDTKSLSYNNQDLESESFLYEPLMPLRDPKDCMIYIAGPFFTMSQYWLVSEAREALLGNGYQVFSPVHDVGIGSAEEVVYKDLEGLRNCQVVLALCDGLDSGTLFEVGYAVNEGIPVIAFAEQTSTEAMKMLDGTGCQKFSDFTSAIYHAQWAALTK